MNGFFERTADRLNPLIVQELRRGLRARLFSASFALLLAACVVVSLVSYGVWASNGTHDEVGAGAFIAFYACLAAVCFFILPLSAFRSLAREQEDHTWPLLVLTSLQPRRILAGKIGSSLLQALLFGSAVAPFLLFSYLLQGVGLLTVGLVFVLSLAWQVFLTVTAVAAATLASSRFWRGLVHFAVLIGLGLATILAVTMAAMLVEEFSGQEEMLAAFGFAVWLMIAYCAIFFAVAVGRLTFESDNRALWTRLALLFHFIGSCLACYGFVWLAGGVIHQADVVAVPLGAIGVVHAWAAGFFMTTCPAGEPRRLRVAGRRRNLPILRPGLARAFRLFALLVAGFAGGAALLGRDNDEFVAGMGAAAALAVLYLSVPLILGRGPLEKLLSSPAAQRLFCLGMLAAGLGGPPLLGLILGGDGDDEGLNFFNPIFALERVSRDADGLWVLGPCALAAALVAHHMLQKCDRAVNEAQDRARESGTAPAAGAGTGADPAMPSAA